MRKSILNFYRQLKTSQALKTKTNIWFSRLDRFQLKDIIQITRKKKHYIQTREAKKKVKRNKQVAIKQINSDEWRQMWSSDFKFDIFNHLFGACEIFMWEKRLNQCKAYGTVEATRTNVLTSRKCSLKCCHSLINQ